AQSMSLVVKIYTADEVAGLMKVDYKTVLNLIKRGHLKCLSGIRHKRITEEALDNYLGVKGISATASSVLVTPPARPAGPVSLTGKSLVSPAAKAVASPVTSVSQKKV
ncbi:MAG: helix-turn-helix domain-containing protein, partial [Limisphaerales bacterium]